MMIRDSVSALSSMALRTATLMIQIISTINVTATTAATRIVIPMFMRFPSLGVL